MMMYNILKCFGEGRKKGCAINKILIYNQRHINDRCVGVTAHMYLQAIPPLGGSCAGIDQGRCKDEGICQWQTSTASYLLGDSLIKTYIASSGLEPERPLKAKEHPQHCCKARLNTVADAFLH